MYWNMDIFELIDTIEKININMRCIEIPQYLLMKFEKKGLTLTWDVLKYEQSNNMSHAL